MSWEPLVYIISPEYSERTVLRAQLLGADYNVAAFHNSDEAIPRLVDGVPHIIIVDADHARDETGTFFKLMEGLETPTDKGVFYNTFPLGDTKVSQAVRALMEN